MTGFSLVGIISGIYSVQSTWNTAHEHSKDAQAQYEFCRDRFRDSLLGFWAHMTPLEDHNQDRTDNGDGGEDKLPFNESEDPNAKITVGYGTRGWIAADMPIAYIIQFENKSTATAPAQQVVITDPLPPELDWSTLELGQIAFNDAVVEVPPSLQSYRTDARVSSDLNPVLVEAALNPATGVIRWTMTSIDPSTGALTEDPMAGFLPPNDASHRGEGDVTFTIRPKRNLSTDTEIHNSAGIVFDVNAPIDTGFVTNAIDIASPISFVSPLPAEVSPQFEVSWTGDDAGRSGAALYDIYVSRENGPYQLWLMGTSDTNATFTGESATTYCFYSVATDRVGNREAPPDTPDASTITSLLPLTLSARWVGDRMELRWNAVPGKTYDVEYTPELGAEWKRLDGVTATESTATWTDTQPANARFYRLKSN